MCFKESGIVFKHLAFMLSVAVPPHSDVLPPVSEAVEVSLFSGFSSLLIISSWFWLRFKLSSKSLRFPVDSFLIY